MAAPWDKTNSQILAEDKANRKALEYSRNRAKPTWAQGSLTSREMTMQQRDRDEASRYSYATPWQPRENNVLADFDKQVSSLDYSLKAPWEDKTNDEPQYDARAENYRFETLWEPVEMTQKQKNQLATYEYNPPYRCEFNGIPESHPRNKKLIPGRNNPTVAPWAHGSLPGPAPPTGYVPRPATSLWETPKAEAKTEEIESSGDPILDSLRAQLKARGASGICGLAKKFKIMDDDGSGNLNMDEFAKAMKECNINDLSKRAIAHLFRYFDKDDSGTISYDEFLVGIRGVLNARRRALVHMAFDVLDKDGSGCITVDDIREAYNVSMHPEVIAGTKKPEQVLLEVLENFDVGGDKDGQVTLQEFESYYSNISASVDSDDYFELMMRNAWHISGGEGWCANTTNRRVLVTRKDGTQAVEEIKNDLGIRAGDTAAMAARLKAQGIDSKAINTTGSAGMDQDVPLVRKQPPMAGRTGSSSSSTSAGYKAREQVRQQQQYEQSRKLGDQQAQTAAGGGGKLRPTSLSATMGSISSQDSRYSRGQR